MGALLAARAGCGEAGCACAAEIDDFVGHDEASASVEVTVLVRSLVGQGLRDCSR